MRRYYELKLERNEHPMFSLSWTLLHVIDETSAFHRHEPPTSSPPPKARLILNVGGVDDSSAQRLYARQIYSQRRYPLAAPLSGHHQHFRRRAACARLQPFHDVVPEQA